MILSLFSCKCMRDNKKFISARGKPDLSYKETLLRRMSAEIPIHKSDRTDNFADSLSRNNFSYLVDAILLTYRANRPHNLFPRSRGEGGKSAHLRATTYPFPHLFASRWHYYNRLRDCAHRERPVYNTCVGRPTFRRSTSDTALLNQVASVGSLYAQYHALIFHATYPLVGA